MLVWFAIITHTIISHTHNNGKAFRLGFKVCAVGMFGVLLIKKFIWLLMGYDLASLALTPSYIVIIQHRRMVLAVSTTNSVTHQTEGRLNRWADK